MYSKLKTMVLIYLLISLCTWGLMIYEHTKTEPEYRESTGLYFVGLLYAWIPVINIIFLVYMVGAVIDMKSKAKYK